MLVPEDTRIYDSVIRGLHGIGYDEPLIAQNYRFVDWFSSNDEVCVEAAAFGQTPISYDSACIGVVCANGLSGHDLVNRCRALGAPFVLEIKSNEVLEWAVSRIENKHEVLGRYPTESIERLFIDRAAGWRPQDLLRAKNIGSLQGLQQLGLFDGLLPELEEHIQAKLDPLLKETLSRTAEVYRETSGSEPHPGSLFKLVFWLLTAKVFHDRSIRQFAKLDPNPEALIRAVAEQYGTSIPRLLNRSARTAAAEQIWPAFDFRNLSVEVLSQIWASTLVDEETKRQLGIHRTSRTIVQYIIDKIPFGQSGDDERIILEPCCGSAVFLIGAMNALRHNLFGATPKERHEYFVKHLVGIESDPFGVEISRLALTLADFPNSDGWDILRKDVFEKGAMQKQLGRAGVVLCNPPFEDFKQAEREKYQPSIVSKPAELLHRVLDHLHPRAVLGFVLPRTFVDSVKFADVRERLARRYAALDITILPDKAFDADAETALVVATDPIPHRTCRVRRQSVDDSASAWKKFELTQSVSSDQTAEFTVAKAKQNLVIPELSEVWHFLSTYRKLREVAILHRGIEWNQPLTINGVETGARDVLVRKTQPPGYFLGVAPKTKFKAFERPSLSFLSLCPEDALYEAYRYDWKRRKAIVGKARKSRGKWKMVSFSDEKGVTCYQTYIAVWPEVEDFDEVLLAAILNSPVANAFVFIHGNSRDVTLSVLEQVPVPYFTQTQAKRLRQLVKRYQAQPSDPTRVLMEIDSVVLDGYRMPARIERELLDFFRDEDRPVAEGFPNYFPADDDTFFNLSDYISPAFKESTAGALLKRLSA